MALTQSKTLDAITEIALLDAGFTTAGLHGLQEATPDNIEYMFGDLLPGNRGEALIIPGLQNVVTLTTVHGVGTKSKVNVDGFLVTRDETHHTSGMLQLWSPATGYKVIVEYAKGTDKIVSGANFGRPYLNLKVFAQQSLAQEPATTVAVMPHSKDSWYRATRAGQVTKHEVLGRVAAIEGSTWESYDLGLAGNWKERKGSNHELGRCKIALGRNGRDSSQGQGYIFQFRIPLLSIDKERAYAEGLCHRLSGARLLDSETYTRNPTSFSGTRVLVPDGNAHQLLHLMQAVKDYAGTVHHAHRAIQ